MAMATNVTMMMTMMESQIIQVMTVLEVALGIGQVIQIQILIMTAVKIQAKIWMMIMMELKTAMMTV